MLSPVTVQFTVTAPPPVLALYELSYSVDWNRLSTVALPSSESTVNLKILP